MDLDLRFANGKMTGTGSDNIGRFFISGRYELTTQECHWTKTYLGAHEVFYRGFREGRGIWGLWEIGSLSRGGFHIWPLQSGAKGEQKVSAEQSAPLEVIGIENTGARVPFRPRAKTIPRARLI